MQDIIEKNEADLREFYQPHFATEEELKTFFDKVYEHDWDQRIPRQMINQIQRFVTISQKIEQIYPPRDGFRLLFLKIAMESINTLDKTQPDRLFYKSFAECFSETAKKYILSNIKLIGCNAQNDTDYISIAHNDLTIDDILNIIKFIRDQVVHDGVFWDFQMFNDKSQYKLLSHIETSDLNLEAVKHKQKEQSITYHFETTLQFDKFTFYFVEACIQYVYNYIEKTKKK